MRIFSDFDKQAENTRGPAEAQGVIGDNLSAVKSVLAIASPKGGSGKSIIAVNVAAALAIAGRKVGIFDADFNAPSILNMLGMTAPRYLYATQTIEPASGPLGIRAVSAEFLPEGQPPPMSFLADEPAQLAAPATASIVEIGYGETLHRLLYQTRFGALDLLIVDLAPGLEHLYRFARVQDRAVMLLVTHPSTSVALTMRRAIEAASHTSLPILGVIENMVGFSCDNCRSVRPLFPEGEVSRVSRATGLATVGRLPFDPRFAESSDRGKPFVNEYPDTPMAKQLVETARRIDGLLAGHARKALPQAVNGAPPGEV